ncbi:uncharacterized protein LOC116179333 [Photinus pyralis]|uniref:uncharacterized protein LOC116179333 n=1 Tax=Photinus pyralis TaxID=7054 RepID=UPI0012672D74|nr:uncharacterized protein LOC116179333 [Photinus pyralis]
MENILDKNEYKNRLITTFSRIGGHKVEEITKLILRKLFVDDLARQYSWMGAKKKLVFSNLKLSDVILKAVRKNTVGKNSTEKDIIDSIKNWLRHADARSKNQKRHQENRTNKENNDEVLEDGAEVEEEIRDSE